MGRGEDQEIDCEIKEAGGKSGFVPEAIIYERVHDERLTLRYLFQAQRSTCLVRYEERYRRGLGLEKFEPWGALPYVCAQLIKGIISFLLIPLTGGRSLLRAIKNFGCAVGCVEGLLGHASRHYAATDGE